LILSPPDLVLSRTNRSGLLDNRSKPSFQTIKSYIDSPTIVEKRRQHILRYASAKALNLQALAQKQNHLFPPKSRSSFEAAIIAVFTFQALQRAITRHTSTILSDIRTFNLRFNLLGYSLRGDRLVVIIFHYPWSFMNHILFPHRH
jgi:hypothetical protein